MTAASASTDAKSHEPLSGVAISFVFWLMLLAAAALFALVSLSPKLLTCLSLSEQQQAQQRELLELERQHAELERVIAALEDDPQFASEMARMEFDAVRPGEEILSMESSLSLAPHLIAKTSAGQAAPASPWRPWVAVFAEFQPLRTALLIAAGVLVLFAFGWMHDGSMDAESSPA